MATYTTVVETVPVRREYLKEVIAMGPTEEVFQDRHVIVEYKEQKVPAKQRYLVKVPYKKTIKVPVYVPCADGAPAPPAPGPVEVLPPPPEKPKEDAR